MSVWPTTVSPAHLLDQSEGELISVSVHADPRDLESLLDALAHVDFPINPQIFHDAAMVYGYADGHETTQPVTLVEFPAYATHLDGLRRTLDACGFKAVDVSVTPMLAELRSEGVVEPAPAGSDYVWRRRRKFVGRVARQ